MVSLMRHYHNMKFPQDFTIQPHQIVPGGIQWRPIIESPVFISVVGGPAGSGLYGNGTTTYEIMIGDDVHGHQTAEEINELIKDY